MIKFTFGDIAVFFAYEALLYLSPVLVGGVAVLLLAPALRARRGARLAAFAMIVAQLALLSLAGPMLAEIWKEKRRAIAFAAATHHLSRPETLGGVHFSAGSTVHLGEDGGWSSARCRKRP